MITLLTGDNSFEIEQALQATVAKSGLKPEKYDGTDLSLSNLPDILMGTSLFATSRLVVIRGLSDNKPIWANFSDWAQQVSDDIELILVEPKVDKRSSAYKYLKEKASLIDYPSWSDRDIYRVEKWLTELAAKRQLKLDTKCIQLIIQRVGLDQWQLSSALDKLSLVETIDVDVIKEVIDATPSENVFELLNTTLSGDTSRIQSMIKTFRASEDVNRLSGLIFSQVFQLAAVAMAAKGDDPAKDFAIHPYVVSKLRTLARGLTKARIKQILSVLHSYDKDIKTTATDPWLLLEQALIKIARLINVAN